MVLNPKEAQMTHLHARLPSQAPLWALLALSVAPLAARAAILLKLGRIHKATLVLECCGQKADVESLMGLLSMEASGNAPLIATASGPEAEPLIRAIEQCFLQGFEAMAGSMGKNCFQKKFERHFQLPH